MKIIYNKLVRDKIPEIIEKSGKKANYRLLTNQQEILNTLVDKVIEEANELKEALSCLSDGLGDGSVDEEFCDLAEVVGVLGNSLPTIDINLWHTKALTKGSFENLVFLESVEEKEK